MYKIGLMVGVLAFSFATIASAHVVVKPSSVGIAAFQTFTMGVPVEQNSATVALKLVIPEGLTYVSPNVKPGWKITVKKEGEGENAKVTEIDWTGGSIPAGQRDDFVFSAKVPSASSTLDWKAYQTYANGNVVAWDHTPTEKITDFSKFGPYSQTKVVDDLSAPSQTMEMSSSSGTSSTALTFSIIALVFSVLAFTKSRRVQ